MSLRSETDPGGPNSTSPSCGGVSSQGHVQTQTGTVLSAPWEARDTNRGITTITVLLRLRSVRCTRHCAKQTPHTLTHTQPAQQPVKQVLPPPSASRRRKQCSSLPRVTQPSSRKPQAGLTPNAHAFGQLFLLHAQRRELVAGGWLRRKQEVLSLMTPVASQEETC